MLLFFTSILRRGLIALPLLLLGLNVYYLIRWGVDIPYWDDWRQYEQGYLGSFNLSYLFTPSNDTLYPVGQFLDSLAFRLFGAQVVPYQVLSLLMVQGSLLWLIWQLLGFSQVSPLMRALAFALTAPMLQSDSYWGLQSMAYHQAVPLIGVLGVLYLAMCFKERPTWLVYAAIVFLGFMSGLTYTSGAFGVLALSLVLLLWGAPYRRYGWVLLVPAVICSLAQLWVIVFYQKGMHISEIGMSYPWQADFWLYSLGKVGRALLLSPTPRFVLWSFIITIGVTVLWALLLLLQRSRSLPFTAISAVVVVYLGLVAAGRAGLKPEGAMLLDVFSYGFGRFHFFWVTLIWPFFTVALWQWLSPYLRAKIPNTVQTERLFVGAVSLVIVALIVASHNYRYSSNYKHAMEHRKVGIACLKEKLVQDASEILCPTLLPYNLLPGLQGAIKHQAPFVERLGLTDRL